MTNPALLTGGTSHPYRFTGKELDKVNNLNMYDFGARWYDVAGVPMWTSVDPLAEEYYNVSPYAYCAGNPVLFVDPDGENPIYDTHGNFLGCTSEGYTGQIYVYKGSEILDWGNQTIKDLLEKDDVGNFMTFEAVESSYLGDAKAKLVSNVMTDIVKHAENKHIFEYSFSTSTLYEGGIGFNLRSDSHFSTEKRKGEDKVRIVAHENIGRDYEATVENLFASLLVHEWYSHGIKGYGDAKNNHRLAYSNVMRDKTFYPKTTIKYKNFVRNMYNYYRDKEIK
jgi:RHS repeat-associated protein